MYTKNDPVSNPGKHITCFVRGRGGGKTRTLIEIEKNINQNYPDCFALSITFNGRWRLYDGHARFTDYNSVVFYSVLSRILSMYYGLKLKTIDSMLKRYVDTLDEFDLQDFFEATIYHTLRKERKSYFILQMDAPEGLVEHISKLFSSCHSSYPPDYLEELRICVEYTMQCGGLVISAVNMVPFGNVEAV
jgi:hypothetical protein